MPVGAYARDCILSLREAWPGRRPSRPDCPTGGLPNQLQVDVGQDDVRFLVNGQLATALRRDARFATDGVVGLCTNHQLDVHVAGFGVEPLTVGAAMK